MKNKLTIYILASIVILSVAALALYNYLDKESKQPPVQKAPISVVRDESLPIIKGYLAAGEYLNL